MNEEEKIEVEGDNITNELSSQVSKPTEELIICESMDLQALVLKYEGNTKIRRLEFVIEKCSNLRVQCLYLLIDEIKKGINIVAYNNAIARAVSLSVEVPFEQGLLFLQASIL